MMYSTIALTILVLCGFQTVYGTTITDLINVCAGPSNDDTATFGWTYELTPGETLDELRWDRINDDGSQTFILRLLSGGAITTAQAYAKRASTDATGSDGSAFLFLNGTTSDDEGKYRCTVTDSSLSGIFDEAQLGLSVPPAPLNQLNVISTTSSSVEVEWEENPISGICKETPRFHVEYRLNQPAGSPWKSAGHVTGSADGIETLSYNVTGLEPVKYEYDISVTANNSQGFSNRTVITLNVTKLDSPLSVPTAVQSSLSLPFALTTTICRALLYVNDARYSDSLGIKVPPIVASIFGAVCSVAVIVSAAIMGDIGQVEIITIIVVSVLALILSIIAAALGCRSKKTSDSFFNASVGIEISAGLMVAITGTVVAAINITGTDDAGFIAALATGGFCIVALTVAICFSMCKRKEPSKVSQDLSQTSDRSQNQVQLQQKQDESNRKPTEDVESPSNENEEHG